MALARVVATGIGSVPYTDVDEALRLVLGELPDLPHLPELPARGAGAEAVGRTAGLLVDLHADLQPAGWRLVGRPSGDARRARELLAGDLDALAVHALGLDGPFKLQALGPWTLVAALELPRGGRVLGDAGAVRDVAESLAAGLVAHVGEVLRRVPGARPVVQLDEPGLPAVLAGRVPTASGFGSLPPVEEQRATVLLETVLDAVRAAGAATVTHCCAGDPPLALLGRADAVGVDATQLGRQHDESLGELLEAGRELWLGLVPSSGPGAPPTVRQTVAPARALFSRLGLAEERLRGQVVVTPACGLAGASSGWVRTALELCRRAAQALDDGPEGPAGQR